MSSPKVGDFLDGYYFAGGDPSKKENWMAPPSVGTVQDGYEYVGGFPGDKNNWKPKTETTWEDTGKGFLSGVSKSVTLGYQPEIASGLSYAGAKAKELVGGEPVPENYFGSKVKEFRDYETETMRKAPIASTVGQVAGFLAPGRVAGAITKGLITGTGKLATLARGVGEGALLGGLLRPEENQSRLESAAYGGLGGAAGTVVGAGLQKGGEALQNLGNTMRITGAGAMLREYRKFLDTDRIAELGKFIKDNKIVGVGSTVGSALKKSTEILEKTGKELDTLLSRAKDKFESADFISKLNPQQQNEYLDAGFFPGSQRDEIMSYVQNQMGDMVEKNAGLNVVKNYLDDLITKYGDDLDIKQAREIKSQIDKSINYSRNPQNPDPAKEQALYHLRTFINNKINKQVDLLADALGGPNGQKLRQLNNTYSNAKTIADMAEDKLAREMANRGFGLSEQIATTGAGMAGLSAYLMNNQDRISQDPIGAVGGGMLQTGILGGLGFLGSRGLRAYGPGIGSVLLDKGGKAIQNTGSAIRSTAPGAGIGLLRD